MIANKKTIFYGILVVVVLAIVGIGLFISIKPIITMPPDTEGVITVSGYVISGGGIIPEGPFDTPTEFIYKIKRNDGSFIDVTYIAYPPSTVIMLNFYAFYAGEIRIGDYLEARGTYNKDANVLTVANEGDYIKTYPEKPSDSDKVTEKGFLEGKVTIGPLCPVQTVPPDPSCQPTEETYKYWQIAIWTSDKKTKVAQIEPNLDGTYKIELPVGNYIVDFEIQQPFGVGGSNLPATISINSGETTTLNIDIDTGIR